MSNDQRKRDNSRAERLEAQLRANLKKRKQQARARAVTPTSTADDEQSAGTREEAGD